MKLFQLINSLDPEIEPERCKIHLAVQWDEYHPLDLYFSGKFDEQQQWQTKQNFEREFVLSLIKLPGHSKWLFVGMFDSESSVWHEDDKCYQYTLSRRAGLKELEGRLIVRYEREGRQSYRYAETLVDALTISEYRPEKMTIEEFSRLLMGNAEQAGSRHCGPARDRVVESGLVECGRGLCHCRPGHRQAICRQRNGRWRHLGPLVHLFSDRARRRQETSATVGGKGIGLRGEELSVRHFRDRRHERERRRCSETRISMERIAADPRARV